MYRPHNGYSRPNPQRRCCVLRDVLSPACRRTSYVDASRTDRSSPRRDGLKRYARKLWIEDSLRNVMYLTRDLGEHGRVHRSGRYTTPRRAGSLYSTISPVRVRAAFSPRLSKPRSKSISTPPGASATTSMATPWSSATNFLQELERSSAELGQRRAAATVYNSCRAHRSLRPAGSDAAGHRRWVERTPVQGPGVVFAGFQRLVPVDVTPDGKEGCLCPCKLWLGDPD
jgi:hypothetical protein